MHLRTADYRHDRHPPDMGLLVCVFALAVIGLVMVYSASQYDGYTQFASTQYLAGKQMRWFLLSVLGFAVASVVDGRAVKKYPWVLGSVALGLLLLVQVFSEKTLGANSRFRLGGMSLQPSEFAKVFMVLFWSAALSSVKSWKDFLKSPRDFAPVAMLGVCIGLVLREPDVGGASVLVFMAVSLLYLKGLPAGYMMGVGAAGGVALWAMILARPYRMGRIQAFLDPWSAPLGKGYNAIQSMMSFASGGVQGVGLGNGKQKLDYLPEQHADFIYSVVGEELGLIGAAVVAFLFAVILWRGMKVALRQRDEFSHLLAVGIVCLLVGQGLLNMLVAVSALPATGLTLPFVSYGGSSLLASAVLAGMLVKLSSVKTTVGAGTQDQDDVLPLAGNAEAVDKPMPRSRPDLRLVSTPPPHASVNAATARAKVSSGAAKPRREAREGREVSSGRQTGAGGRGDRWASLPRY